MTKKNIYTEKEFNDFIKNNTRLVVKVKEDISSQPSVLKFIGNSRKDDKPLYELYPVNFQDFIQLQSKLGVDNIELCKVN